jgi:hypothetical protein
VHTDGRSIQCTTAEDFESGTAQCVVGHGMCIPWILLSTKGDNCGRRRQKERSSEDIWGCCTGFVGYRLDIVKERLIRPWIRRFFLLTTTRPSPSSPVPSSHKIHLILRTHFGLSQGLILGLNAFQIHCQWFSKFKRALSNLATNPLKTLSSIP